MSAHTQIRIQNLKLAQQRLSKSFFHEKDVKDAREEFGTDKRFDEYDNDTHNTA